MIGLELELKFVWTLRRSSATPNKQRLCYSRKCNIYSN